MAAPKAKRPSGRPRLYSDPIFFEEKVEQYFDECEKGGKPPTVAGIAYYLGFEDKESFSYYANYEGFSRTVKKTRLRIEAAKNEMLFNREHSTAGVIFDLKNNHGWADKVEHGDMSPSEYGEEVEKCRREMDRTTVPAESDDDTEVV
jgi:hypothetical protein